MMSKAQRKNDPAQQTVSPAEEVTGAIAYFKWPCDGHSAGANFGAVVNGITVIGQSDIALRRGDRIHASAGRLEIHPKWGRQYHAASIAILPPVNHNEKARLFRMCGVPPQTVKKLLAHFGKDI